MYVPSTSMYFKNGFLWVEREIGSSGHTSCTPPVFGRNTWSHQDLTTWSHLPPCCRCCCCTYMPVRYVPLLVDGNVKAVWPWHKSLAGPCISVQQSGWQTAISTPVFRYINRLCGRIYARDILLKTAISANIRQAKIHRHVRNAEATILKFVQNPPNLKFATYNRLDQLSCFLLCY